MREGITCRELADFLLQYLEGDLSAEQRAEFEQHLDDCPPCIHYLKSYETTVRLEKEAVRDDPGAALPEEEAPEALVQAILAARRR